MLIPSLSAYKEKNLLEEILTFKLPSPLGFLLVSQGDKGDWLLNTVEWSKSFKFLVKKRKTW